MEGRTEEGKMEGQREGERKEGRMEGERVSYTLETHWGRQLQQTHHAHRGNNHS